MSTDGQRQNADKPAPMPLERWLWRAYLRAALIPLLVIELTFLGIYWISNTLVYRENIETISSVSHDYLTDLTRREALSLSHELASISRPTQVLALQVRRALDGNFIPSAAERSRYVRGEQGGLYTSYDNGTTASFYSNRTPIGDEQMRKVWQLAAIDTLMMDMKASHLKAASLYFNSYDGYNRIYPYIDVRAQYPPDADVTKYNFYYEADARHNPERKAVWTDAYIDPAGHGWMVSSIAPVWRGDKLEGVVGIDVTLKTAVDRLVSLNPPWNGYIMLIDRKGRIIALPPKGEADFKLTELTDHGYAEAIRSDEFKPDNFNIRSRAETRPLADAIAAKSSGQLTLQLNGPRLATFARVPGPEWTLVMIAPAKEIYQRADALRDRLQAVGLVMIAALLIFYVAFLAYLLKRSRTTSARVAAALRRLAKLLEAIGAGQHRQTFAGSRLLELDQLGKRLVEAGNQLGDAHDRIVEQEKIVSRALRRQREVNEEQLRFVRVMSHELRTPLAIIDSGAQIFIRKADSLQPSEVRDRSGRMRAAVRRISDLLQKMVNSFQSDLGNTALDEPELADLRTVIREIATEMIPEGKLVLRLAEGPSVFVERAPLAIVIRSVLDNALRYGYDYAQVEIGLEVNDDGAKLSITSQGASIPADEISRIGERFCRGSNATERDGAGISLFVGRTLVEKTGGTLIVESHGNSTTVTIALPSRADPPPSEVAGLEELE